MGAVVSHEILEIHLRAGIKQLVEGRGKSTDFFFGKGTFENPAVNIEEGLAAEVEESRAVVESDESADCRVGERAVAGGCAELGVHSVRDLFTANLRPKNVTSKYFGIKNLRVEDIKRKGKCH